MIGKAISAAGLVVWEIMLLSGIIAAPMEELPPVVNLTSSSTMSEVISGYFPHMAFFIALMVPAFFIVFWMNNLSFILPSLGVFLVSLYLWAQGQITDITLFFGCMAGVGYTVEYTFDMDRFNTDTPSDLVRTWHEAEQDPLTPQVPFTPPLPPPDPVITTAEEESFEFGEPKVRKYNLD